MLLEYLGEVMLFIGVAWILPSIARSKKGDSAVKRRKYNQLKIEVEENQQQIETNITIELKILIDGII